jgi:hypothetical protein
MANSVAAVYFKNGTSVPVAQVQGSHAYQDFIRKNFTSLSHEDSTLCRWLGPTLNGLPSALGVDVDMCRHADVSTVKSLLRTLKYAVESYLGTGICFAALILDDFDAHLRSVAQEALEAVGLHQVLGTILAGKTEVMAKMPQPLPGMNEEPWVVLAVDYSFRWFNVGLYTLDEFGIVDPVEASVSSPRIAEHNRLDALGDAIRHLLTHTTLPDVKLPEQVRHLFVYGDDANNASLHRLLRTILDEDLVRDARIARSVFDGVAEMARNAHLMMDDVDFEMRAQAAWGCKWRSRLYGKHRDEL